VDEVPGDAVIIVDDEDHGRPHATSPSFPQKRE
jgi:hypothetical protein